MPYHRRISSHERVRLFALLPGARLPDAAEPTATDPATPPAPTPPKAHDRRDVDDVVTELVGKYGGERAALRVLADQQLDYRREKRELTGRLPKDGERVLTAAEAKEWDAFTALGKKAKDVTTALAERDALATENAGIKAERVTAEAAQIAGYKPSVLAKLAKTEGFRVEVRDEKDGDATKRAAFAVVGDGEDAKATPLTEYAAASLADFLPALAAEPNGSGPAPRATGAPIPPQPPRGTAPAPKQTTIEQLKESKRATGAYSA